MSKMSSIYWMEPIFIANVSKGRWSTAKLAKSYHIWEKETKLKLKTLSMAWLALFVAIRDYLIFLFQIC